MIAAEGKGGGNSHGDVAEDGHDLVDVDTVVASEVDEVVDAAVEGVVEGGADEVGTGYPHCDILVLSCATCTLAQRKTATATAITPKAIRMVQGLSETSSLAISGWSLRIIFRLTRCDSSPFTCPNLLFGLLFRSYMCS